MRRLLLRFVLCCETTYFLRQQDESGDTRVFQTLTDTGDKHLHQTNLFNSVFWSSIDNRFAYGFNLVRRNKSIEQAILSEGAWKIFEHTRS